MECFLNVFSVFLKISIKNALDINGTNTIEKHSKRQSKNLLEKNGNYDPNMVKKRTN